MGICALDDFLINLISEVAQKMMTLEQKRLCVMCLCHSNHDGTMQHQGNKALVGNFKWHNNRNSNRYTRENDRKKLEKCYFCLPVPLKLCANKSIAVN